MCPLRHHICGAGGTLGVRGGKTGHAQATAHMATSLLPFLFRHLPSTVLLRIKKAFYPFAANDFFEGGSPDLYCPIWTCFTLVFLLRLEATLFALMKKRSFSGWADSQKPWSQSLSFSAY